MRLPDWELRLARAMAPHFKAKWQYGSCDCLIICLDAIEAVTGLDIYPEFRLSYTTEAGGVKLLKRKGFDNVEQLWEHTLDEIPIARAQRGDLCIIDTAYGPAGAPVLTQGAFGKSKDHILPTFISPLKTKRAFKVG